MRLLPFVVSCGLVASVAAQSPSVWHIGSDYHLGSIALRVPNPSSPPATFEGFLASRGTLTMNTDLTWSVSQTDHEVLAFPSISNQLDTASGLYRFTPDGTVLFDADPSNPGTDVFEAVVDRDVTMLLATRAEESDTSYLTVALLKSGAATNGALNGNYRIAGFSYEYPDANGLGILSIKGNANFDGRGNLTVTGTEQEITNTGAISINPINLNGTYSVSPDGTLYIGAEQQGGVSFDGEFFFVIGFEPTGAFADILVGVKVPDTTDLNAARGDWVSVGQMTSNTLPTSPLTSTQLSFVDVDANTSTTGAFSRTGNAYDSDTVGQSTQLIQQTGTLAVPVPGDVQFTIPLLGSSTLHVSPSHKVMIENRIDGTANLTLAMRTCAGSGTYGTGTPGTGGVVPIHSMEAYPILGAPFFALRVENALPGATAGLLITLGQLPGVPILGGTLWVDVGSVLAVPSQTVDPSGVARWLLTPPNDTLWLSNDLFTQALILDAGAPQGIAMTSGFRTAWCR